MRGLLRAGAVLALTAGALVAVSTSPPDARADMQDPVGISWNYSETANGYWRPPAGGGSPGSDGPSGPPLQWKQWSNNKDLVCPENDPAFACAGDPGAEIVGIYCSDLPGPRGLPTYAWILWVREIGPNGEPTPWVGKEADCDEPSEDDFVPMVEISNTINAEVFEPVGEPVFQLWPKAQNGVYKTLVGLPTVLSTEYPLGENGIDPDVLVSVDPTTVRIPVHIPRPGGGLDGTVTATADYRWTWDGGSDTGRGKPFEAGRSPQDNPNYYTTAEFQRVGQQTITLTATWEGTVVVAPLAPEDIVPVVIQHSENVQVQQARSVITQ